MGQQQLLLVILVTILVGIATVVAINVFGSAAEEGNRDAVRQDLLQGAAGAQALWIKPAVLGGANRDFSDLADIDDGTVNEGEAALIMRSLGIPGTVNATGQVENENATYTLTGSEIATLTITATPTSWPNNIVLVVCRDFTTGDEGWKSAISVDGTAPAAVCADATPPNA